MPEYSSHIEIEPRVHLIRGLNNARFPEANSVLVDDEILTLIDAGSSRENIRVTLRDLGHDVKDLERIILTHFHIDHKGHAQYLHDISDCEVICHPSSIRGVESFLGMAEYYGIANHPTYTV
ncbi:MAG: MBL fold metallo-hydrolase, partial [Candidatus Thorarchaeota archaeon]|nr:MBL fold metallo-hydrolase [Candidatus Thorarchaeota archaeon]